MPNQYDSLIKKDSPGDSNITGEYTITKLDNDIYNIHLGIEVENRGRLGTGYGMVLLIVELQDGRKLTFGPITKTEGADAWDSYNKGSNSEEYRTKIPFDDYTEVVTWYLIFGASDSKGYPTSIRDLKELILDNAEFLVELAKIGVGGSQIFGDFKIFRTNIR